MLFLGGFGAIYTWFEHYLRDLNAIFVLSSRGFNAIFMRFNISFMHF